MDNLNDNYSQSLDKQETYLNPNSDLNKEYSDEGASSVISGFDDVKGNFGFSSSIQNVATDMVNVITDVENAPKFTLNVNSKYYKGEVTVIDFSWYAPFKEMGDNIICIFVYLSFVWNIFLRLPDIIAGAGGASFSPNMLQDISAYNHTGFSRTNSYHDRGF